ncbi:hypothetical protein T492DRAFT_1002322 [Pavlovales sp. CCMP2436]|nr:hypothetical protein T492DRAFT_1002322 [Pavlovales sp. CCMP2436]
MESPESMALPPSDTMQSPNPGAPGANPHSHEVSPAPKPAPATAAAQPAQPATSIRRPWTAPSSKGTHEAGLGKAAKRNANLPAPPPTKSGWDAPKYTMLKRPPSYFTFAAGLSLRASCQHAADEALGGGGGGSGEGSRQKVVYTYLEIRPSDYFSQSASSFSSFLRAAPPPASRHRKSSFGGEPTGRIVRPSRFCNPPRVLTSQESLRQSAPCFSFRQRTSHGMPRASPDGPGPGAYVV